MNLLKNSLRYNSSALKFNSQKLKNQNLKIKSRSIIKYLIEKYHYIRAIKHICMRAAVYRLCLEVMNITDYFKFLISGMFLMVCFVKI